MLSYVQGDILFIVSLVTLSIQTLSWCFVLSLSRLAPVPYSWWPLFCVSFIHVIGGGIFKLLWSPEIGSKESIPPAYVAWRAGTKTLFLLGSWPPQIVQKFQHGTQNAVDYMKYGCTKTGDYMNSGLTNAGDNCTMYMNSGLIILVDYMSEREHWLIIEDQASHCRIFWHLSHPSPSPVCKLSFFLTL